MYLWLLYQFHGTCKVKLYTPSHGTNLQNQFYIKTSHSITALYANHATWHSTRPDQAVCIPFLGWLIHLLKQFTITAPLNEAKSTISKRVMYILPQLLHWQCNLFSHVNQIKICYVYLNLNWSVGEALQGGFKLHHIWQGTMFCCCTTLNRL